MHFLKAHTLESARYSHGTRQMKLKGKINVIQGVGRIR
jgi:hypothetical protein